MSTTFVEVSLNTMQVLHLFLLKYLMCRCLLPSNLNYYNLKKPSLILQSLCIEIRFIPY